MKNFDSSLILFVAIGFVLSSCGDGGMKDNTYLGKLPSISKKYQDKEEALEEKAKKSTDMEDAYKYSKEAKLVDEEGDKAIEEYLTTNTFEMPIPFDNNSESKYEILSLNIDNASMTRINLILTIKLKEDIKNEYGNFKKNIFAYIKAIDKSGSMLGKPGVMAFTYRGEKPEAGTEATLKGSVGNLREFEEFDKIVFLSKEEYNAVK